MEECSLCPGCPISLNYENLVPGCCAARCAPGTLFDEKTYIYYQENCILISQNSLRNSVRETLFEETYFAEFLDSTFFDSTF